MFAILIGAAGGYVLVQAAGLLVEGWPELVEAPGWPVAVWLLVDVALAALGLALIWMALPLWQLILRPGSVDDVVVEVAESGLTLADAGYRVAVAWAALDRIEVIERGDGWYRLLVHAPEPVDGTADPVGRMVRRRLSKEGMTLKFTDREPTEEELASAVAAHSRGRFSLVEAN